MTSPLRRGRRRNLRTYFAPPGNFVASDTFARLDGTALGCTDGLPWMGAQAGRPYVEIAGNWEINGHRLGSQGSSPGGQGWLVTLDLGISDYVIEWTLASSPDANANSIVVAYIDDTNFLRITHNSTALGFLRITAGGSTVIGINSTGAAPTLGDVVRISKLGAAYSARIIRVGAQVGVAAAASETQGQSSTVIGLRAAAASVRWRNFLAMRA